MAGIGRSKRKAYGHEDLRHRLFGGGKTAAEDMRVGYEDRGKKPPLLNMLFRGGPARQVDAKDYRINRPEAKAVKPAMLDMLFRGGAPRALAREDERMGHDDEDEQRPLNMEMLAEGGEYDDEHDEHEGKSDEELLAAHEVMDAVKHGDADALCQALKAFFYSVDVD